MIISFTVPPPTLNNGGDHSKVRQAFTPMSILYSRVEIDLSPLVLQCKQFFSKYVLYSWLEVVSVNILLWSNEYEQGKRQTVACKSADLSPHPGFSIN